MAQCTRPILLQSASGWGWVPTGEFFHYQDLIKPFTVSPNSHPKKLTKEGSELAVILLKLRTRINCTLFIHPPTSCSVSVLLIWSLLISWVRRYWLLITLGDQGPWTAVEKWSQMCCCLGGRVFVFARRRGRRRSHWSEEVVKLDCRMTEGIFVN